MELKERSDDQQSGSGASQDKLPRQTQLGIQSFARREGSGHWGLGGLPRLTLHIQRVARNDCDQ